MAGVGRGFLYALVAASVAWPALLFSTVVPGPGGDGPAWRPFVLLASSRVCHRLPERSFTTAGLQWAVCGRCSGLYLAAPVGALAAVLVAGRRRSRRSNVTVLTIAALPTVVTLGFEWSGLTPVSNVARLVAALPLGAAVAFVIAGVAGEPAPIGYTRRP